MSIKGLIVIIAEHEKGDFRPVTWELAAFARKIQSHRPAEIRAVVLGDHVEASARHLSETAGIPVTLVSDACLKDYSAERHTMVLHDVLKGLNPSFVCLAHSTRGAELAPGLAFKLSSTCISGVEDVRFNDDGFQFARAIYGGKILAAIASATHTTVLTLQPGSLRPDKGSNKAGAVVEIHEMVWPDREFESLSIKPAQTGGVDLSEAKVLIAAGRGIGEEENLEMVRSLAAVFPQSAVCGSRPIVDAGWMTYSRQVGVTGATVSPALYLACGISGAVQHVSGMRGSGFVVSVNTDPGAAIFNDSDICIVEDLSEFIPLFIETVSKQGEGT